MKSKKTIVSLALIIAVLVLGIGYATLSQTLKITGNAKIQPDDFIVHFDDSVELAAHVDSIEYNDTKTEATITLKLDRNDYNTVTQPLTVVNESPELYANFATSNLYTVTYNGDAADYITVTPGAPSLNKLAPVSGSANLDLVVALKDNAPGVDEEKTVSFTVEFVATSSVE